MNYRAAIFSTLAGCSIPALAVEVKCHLHTGDETKIESSPIPGASPQAAPMTKVISVQTYQGPGTPVNGPMDQGSFGRFDYALQGLDTKVLLTLKDRQSGAPLYHGRWQGLAQLPAFQFAGGHGMTGLQTIYASQTPADTDPRYKAYELQFFCTLTR